MGTIHTLKLSISPSKCCSGCIHNFRELPAISELFWMQTSGTFLLNVLQLSNIDIYIRKKSRTARQHRGEAPLPPRSESGGSDHLAFCAWSCARPAMASIAAAAGAKAGIPHTKILRSASPLIFCGCAVLEKCVGIYILVFSGAKWMAS